MKQYSNALLHLERALDILQRVLSENHPRLVDVRLGIETVKKSLENNV